MLVGMSPYRKGELSKSQIDRGWPHQVALASRLCGGERYVKIRLFCTELSLCDRGHAYYRGGELQRLLLRSVQRH